MPIKANAEIEALAARLAALRGQSIEEVLAVALRAELAREPSRRMPDGPVDIVPSDQRTKVDRMLKMVRAARSPTGEIGDRTAFLYDEQGLPH